MTDNDSTVYLGLLCVNSSHFTNNRLCYVKIISRDLNPKTLGIRLLTQVRMVQIFRYSIRVGRHKTDRDVLFEFDGIFRKFNSDVLTEGQTQYVWVQLKVVSDRPALLFATCYQMKSEYEKSRVSM